jgi:hypothetical protein
MAAQHSFEDVDGDAASREPRNFRVLYPLGTAHQASARLTKLARITLIPRLSHERFRGSGSSRRHVRAICE